MGLKELYNEHSQSEDKRVYDDATMLRIYNDNLNKYEISFADTCTLKRSINEIRQVDPNSHQGMLFKEAAELIDPSKWIVPPERITLNHFREERDGRITKALLNVGWYRTIWFDGSVHFWAPKKDPSKYGDAMFPSDSLLGRRPEDYIFGGEKKALRDLRDQERERMDDINRQLALVAPILTKEQGHRLMGCTVKGQEMAVYYSLILYRDGCAYYSEEWQPHGPVNTQGKHYCETDFTEEELVKEIKRING